MGLDFIRQRAKQFTRSWDDHRLSLCERTLFSVDPADSPRRVIARTAVPLDPDTTILMCSEGPNLEGYHGLNHIVSVIDPPPDLVRLVDGTGGCAQGIVRSVLDEALIEIEVC